MQPQTQTPRPFKPPTTRPTTTTQSPAPGIPTNIIDNFFVHPANSNYNPQKPLHGIIAQIGTKISNTAGFIAGMIQSTVRVFVGGQNQN